MNQEELRIRHEAEIQVNYDKHKQIKELRTRVAELEKLIGSYDKCLRLGESENSELQNRLSTVEKENSKLRTQNHFKSCDNCKPVFCCGGLECGCYGQPIDYEPSDKCEQDCVLKQIQSLETKLSTLLKASEGLGKALEEILDDYIQIGCDEGTAEEPYINLEIEKKSQQALADFRAVKEESK